MMRYEQIIDFADKLEQQGFDTRIRWTRKGTPELTVRTTIARLIKRKRIGWIPQRSCVGRVKR